METKVLPSQGKPSSAYPLSIAIAIMMALLSLAGLLFVEKTYPNYSLRRSFVPNDVVNLLLGLPILLTVMGLARRRLLLGFLLWLGVLFYVIYNYIAYTVAVLFSWRFIPYLLLVIVSIYAVVRLLSDIDIAAVRDKLRERILVRFAGGILMGFGGLFFLRSIGQLVQGAVDGVEMAVIMADLVTTPFWIVGGILLWRKHPIGYVCGLGLLFQASMLFVGLLFFFALQPFLMGTLFLIQDFTVIFVMGLAFFIPLGLFIRVLWSLSI